MEYSESRSDTRGARRPLAFVWYVVAALTAAGLTGCITTLYLAGLEVMMLGGFVASGGPYEIAHPAPDWVWVVPVSILSGFAFGGVHLMAAGRLGGFNLLGPAWAALFGSLGWGFLKFGFDPPWGGLVGAWIACGVVFWLMAAPVALGVIGNTLPDIAGRVALTPGGVNGVSGGMDLRLGGPVYGLAHIVAVAIGIWGAAALFGRLAG